MFSNIKKNSGITLVALIVTIIILLILSGISIASLTGNGLFEKAKLAKEKQENSQVEEDETLADYENKINGYLSNSRAETTNREIKSLINKKDGIYNNTEGGYIFSTPTTVKTFTSNNSIILTDSIEKYDYIIFEFDIFRPSSSGYTYHMTEIFSTTNIKDNYTHEYNSNKLMSLRNNLGDSFNRIIFYFYNESNLIVYSGLGNSSSFTKLRITDIKGIKY